MPEPTLALSFNDLILRVAEHGGKAVYAQSAAAAIPTDPHDLDLVKRIVNDGWRRFVNSNPKWHWLTPTFRITFDPDGTTSRTVEQVDGDDSDAVRAARYYAPDGFFGHMVSNFTYPPDGPRVRIDVTDEQQIRELYAAASGTTGDPFLVAWRPIPNRHSATQHNRRWEFIFWPTPDSGHTVTARCRLYPNRLAELEERHAAGFQFDEAVLAACMAEWERQQEDEQGAMESQWAEALTRAIAIDQASAPRRLGYNGDASDGGLKAERPYTGVDTYTSGTAGVITL
jgi:hypothetical protein